MKLYNTSLNNVRFCSSSKQKDKSSKITFKDVAIATTLLGFACKETNYEDLIINSKTKQNSLPKSIANWIYIIGIGSLLITFLNDINKKWLKNL